MWDATTRELIVNLHGKSSPSHPNRQILLAFVAPRGALLIKISPISDLAVKMVLGNRTILAEPLSSERRGRCHDGLGKTLSYLAMGIIGQV